MIMTTIIIDHPEQDEEEKEREASPTAAKAFLIVSFGICDIRTYNQVIGGDPPCCLDGFPIQLGWEYRQEPSIAIYMNTNNTNAVNGNRTNAIVTATLTELHSSSIYCSHSEIVHDQ